MIRGDVGGAVAVDEGDQLGVQREVAVLAELADRVQAAACELFLLWTQTPLEQLRIELSQPLGAIQAARAAAAVSPPARRLSSPSWQRQLNGSRRLLTREELGQLTAKLLNG